MMKTNIFLKTIDLNGNKQVYQIPYKIAKFLFPEMKDNYQEIKTTYKNALINVPAGNYINDHAKMKVVKVVGLFTEKKRRNKFVRGQMITYDAWSTDLKNTKKYTDFMAHDYEPINKARIKRDIFKWLVKEKYQIKAVI